MKHCPSCGHRLRKKGEIYYCPACRYAEEGGNGVKGAQTEIRTSLGVSE